MLYGGFNYDNNGNPQDLGDTWEWNGTVWMLRPSELGPCGARQGHAMTYDSARGVTILFGGNSSTSQDYSEFDDTWEWNGSNWLQRRGNPPPASNQVAFDSARGVTVGVDGDTSEWNGALWRRQCPENNPPARDWYALAYDSGRGVTVLFGGGYYWQYTVNADTWEYDGVTWTQRMPSNSPPGRLGHAMCYDSARGVTLLYGGDSRAGYYFGDMWQWDGVNWTQLLPPHVPSARAWHAMAFDTDRGVAILFGGRGWAIGDLGDTWEWNGSDWRRRFPVGLSPSARTNHAMAYDSARSVMLLFGGNSFGTDLGDTWELTAVAPPCVLNADLNCSSRGDGPDVQEFVNALFRNSTAAFDVCHADFNGDGVIDLGDLPGFVQKLLGQ